MGLREREKEGRTFLFNDALNTFYLRLHGVGHMVKEHSDNLRGNPMRHYMGHTFRLAAKVLLYASSHRQDCTYYYLCYTSRGALYNGATSHLALRERERERERERGGGGGAGDSLVNFQTGVS